MESRRLHGRRGLKFIGFVINHPQGLSPPSRAAWIEIFNLLQQKRRTRVAAFTGGVD